MTTWTSKGVCNLCHRTFSRVGMVRHLESCQQRNDLQTLAGRGRPRQTWLFHLAAWGIYSPDYWMNLQMPADATLRNLDDFLRGIWLECCGHLSAFTIQGIRYISYTPEWIDDRIEERTMDVRLDQILEPGLKFEHEYDFGTPTCLALKAVGVHGGRAKGKSIQVLARNDPPPIVCDVCGKPAKYICTLCMSSGKGCLCAECAGKHECGDEMFLPVVNSPRVGMCGSWGPEEQ